MKKYWLIIKLHSDMCPATGNAVPGVVDMEASEEYGFPIIYGKRLKGVLLETAEELLTAGMIIKSETESLFGRPGQAVGGSLRVHDAHIWKVPGEEQSEVTVEDYDSLLQEIQQIKEIKPAEIREYFTRLRTQTAMERGTAKKHNLRTMRVINRGLVFRALLEVDDDSSRQAEVLNMCIKALRGIGTGVSRGMGEVTCTCEPCDATDDSSGSNFKVPGQPEEEMVLEYELYLKTPLILTDQRDRAVSEIGGRAISGAFAGMFVKDYDLGDEAHKNQDFRKIFLEGGVQFGFAFPKMQGDYKEYLFYPCPRFLKRVKRENTYVNLMQDNPSTDRKLEKENSFVHLDAESAKILACQVKKEVRMHHARPSDHGIGHASEQDGQLYSYQSVAAGQTFKGSIKGKCRDLQRLMRCLERREGRMRLGKSRTTEYGDVDFRIVNIMRQTDKKSTSVQVSEALLWFVTPLILQESETGDIRPDLRILEKIIEDRLGCKLAAEGGFKAFASYMEIGGYNGKWRLPEPQMSAFAPGSVIYIKSTQPFDAEKLEDISWGIRGNEGYGKARVLMPEKINQEFARVELNEFKGKIRQNGMEKSPLINIFLQRQKEARKKAEQFHSIVLPEGRVDLNMTTLNQFYRLFRISRKKEKWLELLEQSAGKIKNEKKKKAVEGFLKELNGKTSDYAEIYFKYAIWEKRMEGQA